MVWHGMEVFCVPKPLVGGFGCDELVLYGIKNAGVCSNIMKIFQFYKALDQWEHDLDPPDQWECSTLYLTLLSPQVAADNKKKADEPKMDDKADPSAGLMNVSQSVLCRGLHSMSRSGRRNYWRQLSYAIMALLHWVIFFCLPFAGSLWHRRAGVSNWSDLIST